MAWVTHWAGILLLTASAVRGYEGQEVPSHVADKALTIAKPGNVLRRHCLPCRDTTFVEIKIATSQKVLTDSADGLYSVQINGRGRLLSQYYYLENGAWKSLAVTCGLNWPGTPAALEQSLKQSGQWKNKDPHSWTGTYRASQWIRSNGSDIAVIHILRVYESSANRGKSKWMVDGPNIQKRLSGTAQIVGDAIVIKVEGVLPQHYGKKWRKGKKLMTLRRVKKGIQTDWEPKVLKAASQKTPQFHKISPNPHLTWE